MDGWSSRRYFSRSRLGKATNDQVVRSAVAFKVVDALVADRQLLLQLSVLGGEGLTLV